MSQKRTQDHSSFSCNLDDGNGNHTPGDKRRRSLPSFRRDLSVVREAMRDKNFPDALEPMLRRIVKEEVESAIKKHVISLKRNFEDDCCESRNLQLKFLNALSLPVFTGTRIEGEDGSPIKMALIDSVTEQIVENAPQSCSKVEVVVLEGDFDGDEVENWTEEEFENNVVREREGKKPLLNGDVHIYLKEGIGFVGEISFTDNSSWTRSRRFRLGARVIGNYDGIRVREAKSESFVVRDHRGELYKKHYPPNLSDEVWRLEKIGKDGAFHKRLSIERVRTVKDFLILFHSDPTRLKNILGSGMSAKMWESTIEHAKTCILDKKVYMYYSPMSQRRSGVVFNVVGQLIGLYSENQFVPVDKVPESEKINSQKMVIEAFQQWNLVISFDNMNSITGTILQSETSSMSETSDASNLLTSQSINKIDDIQSNIPCPINFSPLYSLGCSSTLDEFPLHGIDAFDLRFDQTLDIPLEISNALFGPSHSMTREFPEDEDLGFVDMDDPSIESTNADLQSAYSGFMKSQSSGRSLRGPGQRRWRILSSILRWFRLRRLVHTRRLLCTPVTSFC